MANIDWISEAKKRKADMIRDLQGLLRIKSVLNEQNQTEGAPLGKE